MTNEYICKQDAIDLINKISNLDLKAKGGICVSLANLQKADVVQVEELKAEIYKLKHQSEQSFGNHDYYVGYISALSTVEGILAVMDREE